MELVKVVMLTSMAGESLSLTYDDVYETDEVEAARFLDHKAAREFDPKTDANKPVKRKPEFDLGLEVGHYQNEKPKEPKSKNKSRKVAQPETNGADSETNGADSETNGADSETNGADSETNGADSETDGAGAGDEVPVEQPAEIPAQPAPDPKPPVRRRR
jgi:hypothetical protein